MKYTPLRDENNGRGSNGAGPSAFTIDDDEHDGGKHLPFATLEIATEDTQHGDSLEERRWYRRYPKYFAAGCILIAVVAVSLITLTFLSATGRLCTATAGNPFPACLQSEPILTDAHVHVAPIVPTPNATDDAAGAATAPTHSLSITTQLTVSPLRRTSSLAVHLPAPLYAASFAAILSVTLPPTFHEPEACVCSADDPASTARASCFTDKSPFHCQGAPPCSQALSPLAPPQDTAFSTPFANWFALKLPSALAPGRPASLTFRACMPVSLETPTVLPMLYAAPSVLASGCDRSQTTLSVQLTREAADLTALFATPPEEFEYGLDGSVTTRFKSLRWVTPNMLSLALGRMQRLVNATTDAGRALAVWGSESIARNEAEVAVAAMASALQAYPAATGESMPELGKIDMVVHDGLWSSSNFGLLSMDRYRTLWSPTVSTASDLLRAAHITCHETGHIWFGGNVQMYNSTEKHLVEESTNSFEEVGCVAAMLPAFRTWAPYAQHFTPPFRDSRHIHIGAQFHALDVLADPVLAGKEMATTTSTGGYTLGPAFFMFLRDYMEAAIGPGAFQDTMREFMHHFGACAATSHDLLEHFAGTLTGLEDAAEDTEFGGRTAWLTQLTHWVHLREMAPIVTIHGETSTDAAMTTLSLTLRRQPMHSESLEPVWLPVALGDAALNGTSAAMTDAGVALQPMKHRWVEFNHIPAPDTPTTCSTTEFSAGGAGAGSDAVERTLCPTETAPPLHVAKDTGPWLPKASLGGGLYVADVQIAGYFEQVADMLRSLQLSPVNASAVASGPPSALNATPAPAPAAATSPAPDSIPASAAKAPGDIEPDDPILDRLVPLAALINDQRLLFAMDATPARLSTLEEHLLPAAGAAPVVQASGLAAYALLSPALTALDDLRRYARGDEACLQHVVELEATMLSDVGPELWTRALQLLVDEGVGKDLRKATQDAVFLSMVVARAVPRAAAHLPEFAKSICSRLPLRKAASDLDDVIEHLDLPADLLHVVLQVAVGNPQLCAMGAKNEAVPVTEYVADALKDAASAEDALQGLPHRSRALAFTLASSPDQQVLGDLMRDVVLGGTAGAYGLRTVDLVTLTELVISASTWGMQAAREAMQEFLRTVGAQLGAEAGDFTPLSIDDAGAAKHKQGLEVVRDVAWLLDDGSDTEGGIAALLGSILMGLDDEGLGLKRALDAAATDALCSGR